MNCRVCGFKTIKIYSTTKLPEYIWPTKKKISYSRCNVYSCVNCFHLQLQNFSKKRILKFYEGNQFNKVTVSNNNKRLSLITKKYGRNYFKNKSILDVGGGINPILKKKNVFLADIIVQKENKYNFKNKFYEIDIEKKKVNQKFDIIFLMHTLEHFKQPKKALDNIISSLKDNGKLFLEIPNFNYFINRNTYYAIFHQHLSMFTMKHLTNFLSLSGLSVDKLFIKKEVIFCSVKKNKFNKKKLSFINNKKIIRIFSKNYILMKKKILSHLIENNFDIYGAGGSMALALASIGIGKKKIDKVFDNDSNKCGLYFPGTKVKIMKKKNTTQNNNIFSLSTYNLKKKNNFNIQNL